MTFDVHLPYLYKSFTHLMLDNQPELRKNQHINMVADHVMYNRTEFEEIMPNDTVYITSLREPVSHFKSLFNHHVVGNISLGYWTPP